jgi:hypothetical protein
MSKEPNKEQKPLNELKKMSHKFDYNFKVGRLNFNTPLNIYLKEFCKEEFESMILHKNIFIQELKKECSVFILKEKLIISNLINSDTFSNDDKKDPTIHRFEIKRILDVDIDPTANDTSEVKITILNGTSIEEVRYFTFKFVNQKEAQIFKYFIEKEKMSSWQQFFENSQNSPIPEKFIYQYHFFLKKVNSRGEQEQRVIVLTNEFILNIDYQIIKKNENEFIFKLHKAKWALSIKSFEELQLVEKEKKKNNFVIKIKVNQKENKNYVNENKLPFKNKSSTEFIFQNEKICRFFIFQIKRLYASFGLGDKKFINVIEK